MNNKVKTIIKVVVGLLIGGGLLYLAFKDVDWEDFTKNLKEVSIGFISLGVLAMFASHISRALRWKQLINANNIEVRTSSAFWAVLFGYTVNNAIPRGGEIARCTILKESDDVPVAISMGTVVVERAIDMLIMAGLFAGIFLMESGTFIEKLTENLQSAKYLPYIMLAFVGVFALFSYLIIRYQYYFYKFRLLKPIVKFLVSLVEAILSVRKVENKFLFVFHTAVIWILYILSNYFMVLAFPMLPDRSFYFAYLTFVMGAIGIIIPSPGGLGSYHSIIVYLFEILNYSKKLGQLFAFVVHSAIYVPTTIAGGIAYFILIFNKKSKTL